MLAFLGSFKATEYPVIYRAVGGSTQGRLGDGFRGGPKQVKNACQLASVRIISAPKQNFTELAVQPMKVRSDRP